MQDRLPIFRTSDPEMVRRLRARTTSTETALYLLASDTLWHIVLILGLFISTTDTFNSAEGHWVVDGLYGINKERLYAAYDTACGLLQFQIIAFFAIFIFRSIYETHRARQDDDTSPTRVREEDSDRARRITLTAMWLNIILSISFIILSLAESDVRKHHHDTSGRFQHTLSTQTGNLAKIPFKRIHQSSRNRLGRTRRKMLGLTRNQPPIWRSEFFVEDKMLAFWYRLVWGRQTLQDGSEQFGYSLERFSSEGPPLNATQKQQISHWLRDYGEKQQSTFLSFKAR